MVDSVMKKELQRFLDLKVYRNKKNGQQLVILPKKKMGLDSPKKVRITW